MDANSIPQSVEHSFANPEFRILSNRFWSLLIFPMHKEDEVTNIRKSDFSVWNFPTQNVSVTNCFCICVFFFVFTCRHLHMWQEELCDNKALAALDDRRVGINTLCRYKRTVVTFYK